MIQLIHYDAARKALAEAVRFDDVLAVKDMAKHAELYARQARDTELIERATEIKVRAERRAGQMLAEAKLSGDLRGAGNPQLCHEGTIGLSAIGITRKESSRWQKLAAVPDDQFERAVIAAKEVAGEVTTAAMLRVEKTLRASQEPQAPEPDPQPAPEEPAQEETETSEQDDNYTELDAAHDQISQLQDMLAVAKSEPADRTIAEELIASLRAEIATLKATLQAVTVSRDILMRENAEMKKQLKRQRDQIKKMQSA